MLFIRNLFITYSFNIQDFERAGEEAVSSLLEVLENEEASNQQEEAAVETTSDQIVPQTNVCFKKRSVLVVHGTKYYFLLFRKTLLLFKLQVTFKVYLRE